MAMSRKDYQAFANLFSDHKPIPMPAGSTRDSNERSDYRAWENLLKGAADIFAADNSRFDRNRFYDAAGKENV